MNERNQSDTIIIGGGLAGLTAAAYLARAGKQVTVLEKAKGLGGRAQTQVRNGYQFNLGPHALYMGTGGTDVLAELEVAWSGGKATAAGNAVYKGNLYRLPVSPKSILQSKLLSAGEKIAFARLYTRMQQIDPATVAEVPVGTWINQQTDSPRLRHLLAAIVRISTYANAPEQLSMAVFLQQLQLGADVRYLDGGWQTLVTGLQETAVSHGADIRTGVRVTGVVETAEAVTVHLANGESLQTSSVILAVDPQTAGRLLPANQALRQWAETTRPVRAAILDVALSRLPNPEGNFALGIDEPTYLSNHTRFAQLGPQGGHLLHVAKYLPLTETDPAQDEAALTHLLDLCQPGWQEHTVERRFLPNMVVINRLATAEEGGLNGRPGYVLPHSQRLYLAGDWVGPHGWLADAAFVSGKQAAELALAQRSVQKSPAYELVKDAAR